jgi:hypothetical protein
MWYDNENYLMRVSTTVDIAGEIKSNGEKLINVEDYAISISSPITLGTVVTLVSPFRSFACTISSITARCIGGTNAQFMIEQRSIASSNSAGTDIWSGDVTATPDEWLGGAVADLTVPVDYGLFLVITSVGEGVDRLMIKYNITKD